jgi:cellulose synthase/poly-beta-1,6-N-acetylglucosamine synthase-like glycosyltransferase
MKDIVQIVILSRDRPKYLKQTVDSVLNQKISREKFEIIISDNSDKDDVKEMIGQDYSNANLKYIRRSPSVSLMKHFQLVISECDATYAVLFHDDDIMHPNYIETMLPNIQKKDVAAVCCNSYVFNNDISRTTGEMHNYKSVKTFTNENDFLGSYVPWSRGGIAPMPGYIYKTEFLKRVELKRISKEDNFSDTLMLSAFTEYGSIVWVPDFLMYYRVHDSNEHLKLYTVDNIAVLNRMFHNGLRKDTDLMPMRFNYLLIWLLRQDKKNIFSWRNKIIFKYLFFNSFYLVRKKNFWKSFSNRFIKKYFLK